MRHQQILFERTGQTFSFDPSDGMPSAPSVIVYDHAGIVAATTGACTVDPTRATIDGPLAAGTRLLPLLEATLVPRPGRYLLASPTGVRSWVDIVAVRDVTATVKMPLADAYPEGTQLIGCRMSIAVADAWARDRTHLTDEPGTQAGLAGYRLRWTYTVDGFEKSGISYADLVRTEAALLVTPRDVEARFPGWIATLPPEHRANQGSDFIAEAFTAVRLETAGDHHAVRNVDVLRELVKIRAHVIEVEHHVMHGTLDPSELHIAETRYRTQFSRLVEQPKLRCKPLPQPPASIHKLKRSEPGAVRKIPKLT